jgi:peptidyl-prolyl cis-trans isomerase SurA
MQLRSTLAFRIALACAAPAATSLFAMPVAQAQQLVLTVNGDPITSYDVEQRVKLLRILKRPAGRPEAIEDLITDRLKLREMSKYQITASEQDILTQGARDAAKAKLSPQALGQALQSARIDEQQWKDHFRAEYIWNVYVAALNKTVEVSEADVRAELAKRGKNTAITEYVLRQVVLVVPGGAGANVLEGRAREAQGLRTRGRGEGAGDALERIRQRQAAGDPGPHRSRPSDPAGTHRHRPRNDRGLLQEERQGRQHRRRRHSQ